MWAEHLQETKHVLIIHTQGWTALHLAAQEGKLDAVGLLLDAEAQINIQTEVDTL